MKDNVLLTFKPLSTPGLISLCEMLGLEIPRNRAAVAANDEVLTPVNMRAAILTRVHGPRWERVRRTTLSRLLTLKAYCWNGQDQRALTSYATNVVLGK